MEDKEGGDASSFLHQIVDFAPAPACTLPAPTQPLHYNVALDTLVGVKLSIYDFKVAV